MVANYLRVKEEQLGIRYVTDIPGSWSAVLSWVMVGNWPNNEAVMKEMIVWLTDRFGSSYYPGVWRVDHNLVYFKHRADAMLFKLTWHGMESAA